MLRIRRPGTTEFKLQAQHASVEFLKVMDSEYGGWGDSDFSPACTGCRISRVLLIRSTCMLSTKI